MPSVRGNSINRALSDLQNVRAFVETVVNQSLEIGLTVGAYILLLVTISPWIALLSLLPLPLWTFYILQFSKKVQPAAKAVMEAEDKQVSILTENIAGVHVVKAFATEQQEIDKYDANIDTFLSRVLTPHPAVRRLHADHSADRDGVASVAVPRGRHHDDQGPFSGREFHDSRAGDGGDSEPLAGGGDDQRAISKRDRVGQAFVRSAARLGDGSGKAGCKAVAAAAAAPCDSSM